MKITAIELLNVRSFKSLPKTELSPNINLFIGSNNSGKSTIINSIYSLQLKLFSEKDITIGKKEGHISFWYKGTHNSSETLARYTTLSYSLKEQNISYGLHPTTNGLLFPLPNIEPNNLIYPYLSKRKVSSFSNVINESTTNSVLGNLSHLYSKVDRLINPDFQPHNQEYTSACESILGFKISTIVKGDGKEAVYYVTNTEQIPITAMGEGVSNLLGLIADLCMANDRIFLIEEPENDIHPKALKALLNLIIEKSKTNQFFISTHSNIVVKYLGAVPDSKLFNITKDTPDEEYPKLFISQLTDISSDPEARRQALEELGYELYDFDLWKGWLFLEESSAEIIIRNYLIDWFVPELKNKLKTFSAQGVGNIEAKLDDFNRLFTFLHLEPTYKNKVWILIDSGENELKIINKLRETYTKSGWNSTNFMQLNSHDFEKYYPSQFQIRVDDTLAITNKTEKREAKKQLLNDIKEWINNNPEEAKKEFEINAKEVIGILVKIKEQLIK